MNDEEWLIANYDHTKMLLDFLLHAMNWFCDQHPEFREIDVFMAAHNFHAVTVLSLERDLKLDTEMQLLWRKLAKDTFNQAMETKPAFTQEVDK